MGGSAGNKSAIGVGQLEDVARTAGNPEAALLFSGDNWYFRARKRALTEFIATYLLSGSCALDVGCGDGWLREQFSDCEWFGIEPDPALAWRAAKKGVTVYPGKLEDSRFGSDNFDAAIMLDVLEHIGDDRAAVQEMRRVLKPGGVVFVSVPLHQCLWSKHDIKCGHKKRYATRELSGLLESAGFVVQDRRFFVSLLLPLVWLQRKAGFGVPDNPVFDRILYRLLTLDTRFKWPFGLTEVVAARKGVAM